MTINSIPFDKIDRNKWNGLVHFAPDSNIYGYYWYLKAVLHDFDILVEGDYQSGMPLIQKNISQFCKKLIPQTGIYTMNVASRGRINTFIDALNNQYPGSFQSFKPAQSSTIFSISQNYSKVQNFFKPLDRKYEDIELDYKDQVREILNLSAGDSIRISANLKPEDLLVHEKLSTEEKNTLFRLMYNAMHRGVCFTSQVEDTRTGKRVFAVFFYNQQTMHEIYCSSKGEDRLYYIMYDYIFRTHAGRNLKLHLSPFVRKNVPDKMSFYVLESLCTDALLLVDQPNMWKNIKNYFTQGF